MILFSIINKVLIFITLAQYSQNANIDKNSEIPHAREIRRLVEKYILKNAPDGSDLRRYIFDGVTKPPSPLDKFKKLTPENMKRVVEMSKKYAEFPRNQYEDVGLYHIQMWEKKLDFMSRTNKSVSWFFDDKMDKEMQMIKVQAFQNLTKNKNGRRNFLSQNQENKPNSSNLTNFRRSIYLDKGQENSQQLYLIQSEELNTDIISFMQQSMFQTKYNLKRTYEIRKRYENDTSFRIAIMHSQIVEYLLKIRLLYSTMLKLYYDEKVKFIHFLIIFEKVLQAQTDITSMVRRIFDEHIQFLKHKEVRAGLVSSTKATATRRTTKEDFSFEDAQQEEMPVQEPESSDTD